MMEQTEIAKQLGISMKAFNRILRSANIDNENHFKLINNKRHYELEEILKIIQIGKHGQTA